LQNKQGALSNPTIVGVPITSTPTDVFSETSGGLPYNPTYSNVLGGQPAPKPSTIVHLAAGSGADLLIDGMWPFFSMKRVVRI
jgi:hypothetical protein